MVSLNEKLTEYGLSFYINTDKNLLITHTPTPEPEFTLTENFERLFNFHFFCMIADVEQFSKKMNLSNEQTFSLQLCHRFIMFEIIDGKLQFHRETNPDSFKKYILSIIRDHPADFLNVSTKHRLSVMFGVAPPPEDVRNNVLQHYINFINDINIPSGLSETQSDLFATYKNSHTL